MDGNLFFFFLVSFTEHDYEIHSFCWMYQICSFLSLGNIPPHAAMTTGSLTDLLMDMWIISSFWPLAQLFLRAYTLFCWAKEQVWNG